ncbi:MAG: hypothetical protein J6039_01605 [Alphaproteobacteria bacterium]|nr:hypothetical protein [Alphaproteobacteria bacterium]
MRKFFSFACVGILLFLGACENKDSVVSLSKEQVYFFYQDTCPHCHVAAQYIKAKHPNLEVKGLDVKMPGNMRLLQQAVKDYKISGSVGTPLICFGKNYIMGWNEKDEAVLDEYAKSYEK